MEDPEADVDTSDLGADVQVPHRADSVPAARAFLARLLDGWGVADEVIDDAILLTSELMSNAVKHGSGVVDLEIEVNDGLLRVGVHDDDRDTPVVRDTGAASPGGRGMWIVQSLARAWGSEFNGEGPGKTVWFELVLRTPPDQPPS